MCSLWNFHLLILTVGTCRFSSRGSYAVPICTSLLWWYQKPWKGNLFALRYLKSMRCKLLTLEWFGSADPLIFISPPRQVPLSFSTFIRYCLCLLKNRDGRRDDFLESQKHNLAVSDTEQTDLLFGEAPQQFFLAQVTISLAIGYWDVPMACGLF